MFDGLINIVLSIVGIFFLIISFISLGYGIYGMTVPGFDKAVRFASIVTGLFFLSIVLFFYFNSNEDSVNYKHKLVGFYYSNNDSTLILELNKNGSFTADSLLFKKTKGYWELIDFDEFYKIDLYSKDSLFLKSLNIHESNGFCKLRTDDHFTNVVDQMELIKK
jgi:hypothetical protein